MGFRWSRIISTDAGSPLTCEDCSTRDRDNRNCLNWRGLSEEARAVQSYTASITEEHSVKEASKVSVSLGDIRMYECPLSYMSADTIQLLQLLALIEQTGSLLYDGGIAAQPYWLMEAIMIGKEEQVKVALKSKDK